MGSPTLDLAAELVARPSITPADAGCQDLLRSKLETNGFSCEVLQCGDVMNLWARRGTPALAELGLDGVGRRKRILSADKRIAVADIEPLSRVYTRILERLLLTA